MPIVCQSMVRFSFICKDFYHPVVEHKTFILLESIDLLVILHPCFWHLKVFIALSVGPITKHRIGLMEVGSCK